MWCLWYKWMSLVDNYYCKKFRCFFFSDRLIFANLNNVFMYTPTKHLRCGEYLSDRAKETFTTRETERTPVTVPPRMKWLCGWRYMWVQAAKSCEWEVGIEWEEKSCFSETISTKARWKAVTLSWLLFVSCTCTKTEFQVVRLGMYG